eukprot:Blabericola_migrator_1__5687@NODE_2888_length_2237_cov_577_443779_g1812_i0_p2_GENE_NODE_2888_length_2237_cov_577_443779_g1812_i0NODE_2888_length_2237_cov_577_443779_g1812_i0_p2_ORF_typecomplete_len163_score1_15_NODE_2888_length_2237_cov_577_443779_g1812_i0434922
MESNKIRIFTSNYDPCIHLDWDPFGEIEIARHIRTDAKRVFHHVSNKSLLLSPQIKSCQVQKRRSCTCSLRSSKFRVFDSIVVTEPLKVSCGRSCRVILSPSIYLRSRVPSPISTSKYCGNIKARGIRDGAMSKAPNVTQPRHTIGQRLIGTLILSKRIYKI